MDKKGFTLIEVMGVIIILGIIVLIAIPTIDNLTANSDEELYNIQINNIKDGLKNWAIDNSKILPQTEGGIITITLGQLKMGGYVDLELKNPKNNKCFGNDMTLEITRYQKNYIYTVNDTTGTESERCDDYRKPYIILNGAATTYVEINDNYIDKGAIAKDAIGNDLTNRIITTITGSGTTVDTTKLGNRYTITYTVTVDGETTSENRTVIVKDSIAPELTIPDDIIIDKYATSFDVLEGVTATDNSGETINVTAKSNISFGIPGNYIITYTATDSSGNTTTKKRTLSIDTYFENNIMNSDRICITDTNSVCEVGTLVNVQVNNIKDYDFYVIKDTGTKLTLIMSSNVYAEGNDNPNVAWISQEHYEAAGGQKWDDLDGNNYGPITALKALKERTTDWTNLEEYSYELSYGPLYVRDENGNKTEVEYIYSGEYVQNVRTRLPRRSDIVNDTIGCIEWDYTCPDWIYEGLYNSGDNNTYGYWLSDASSRDWDAAWNAEFDGLVIDISVDNGLRGVRPVIEISK